MKTNLKVLMFSLLMGVGFSANAYWGESAVGTVKNFTWGNAKKGYTYVRDGQNWKDNPYYFAAGTTAAVAVTAGIVYLAYKKITAKKAKARLTIDE